ncbi:MAG: RIP metalloprotease RseP [Deltaproteobacteria bacterium]|nr:RIP metalloprotease RseP [Deltaproteobacteria bacterium]MBW1941354.1 RIP metalloprotease RseP [Deltaproteobacteria bacterium]MBW2205347.1 RIP metalloprotease RseP [Deltaproteobacteria bacterium]
MNFLIYYLLPFIVVLGVLVFFHELGHFLVAKYFNVKVLKFALGFGPRLVWKTFGETEYSVRAVPLGGYVKMLGEDPEEEESEDLTPEDAERAFNNQHVLKRIAIAAAGPIFNLILAFFLFWLLYWSAGAYILIPEIGQVSPDSPAMKAGLQKGDLIVAIQDKEIKDWLEIKEIVQDKAGIPLQISVKRGKEFLTLNVVPEEVTQELMGQEIKTALIGIVSSGKGKQLEFGPIGAAQRAFKETWDWIERIVFVIVRLFQGRLSYKLLGGPLMIGQMTGEMAKQSYSLLIPFTAVISVNLAVINLFPIPILDGGLIIFFLVELLIGKPVSLRKREFAQKVGFIMLIFLMLLVTINDLLRIPGFRSIIEKIFG